ncbi:MAG: hypothetical protein U5K72_04350 [Balneolaceae bacterium]|nr:hypothetical protein [Balneolaceae bacterium]
MKQGTSYLFYFLTAGIILILILVVSSCERPNQRSSEVSGEVSNSESGTSNTTDDINANKVSFFVDNSGGMVGYVNRDESQEGVNNFILAVSNLAQNPNFRRDDVELDYNLINGPRDIVTTPLGNSAQEFINCLNPTCFNQGDVSGNDLNAMFRNVSNCIRPCKSKQHLCFCF